MLPYGVDHNVCISIPVTGLLYFPAGYVCPMCNRVRGSTVALVPPSPLLPTGIGLCLVTFHCASYMCASVNLNVYRNMFYLITLIPFTGASHHPSTHRYIETVSHFLVSILPRNPVELSPPNLSHLPSISQVLSDFFCSDHC